MITHLEPDNLECKVKWALGSTSTNKASGGDRIQWSCFKSWKMMLWKCCTQYDSIFGKLSSGHRTEKGQFLFQSQRKAMPKSAQITTQVHSSHTRAMEKSMAPHSSILAWKIPWMEKPGRLQPVESWRVDTTEHLHFSLSWIGEGNGNPLQCSCLGNPRDGGGW